MYNKEVLSDSFYKLSTKVAEVEQYQKKKRSIALFHKSIFARLLLGLTINLGGLKTIHFWFVCLKCQTSTFTLDSHWHR